MYPFLLEEISLSPYRPSELLIRSELGISVAYKPGLSLRDLRCCHRGDVLTGIEVFGLGRDAVCRFQSRETGRVV